jgi:hypothetical protein
MLFRERNCFRLQMPNLRSDSACPNIPGQSGTAAGMMRSSLVQTHWQLSTHRADKGTKNGDRELVCFVWLHLGLCFNHVSTCLPDAVSTESSVCQQPRRFERFDQIPIDYTSRNILELLLLPRAWPCILVAPALKII